MHLWWAKQKCQIQRLCHIWTNRPYRAIKITMQEILRFILQPQISWKRSRQIKMLLKVAKLKYLSTNRESRGCSDLATLLSLIYILIMGSVDPIWAMTIYPGNLPPIIQTSCPRNNKTMWWADEVMGPWRTWTTRTWTLVSCRLVQNSQNQTPQILRLIGKSIRILRPTWIII